MNRLKGKISNIKKGDGLSFLIIKCENIEVKTFIMEENENDFKKEDDVFIFFKESETVLAKDFKGKISFENRFFCRVENVIVGEILAEIKLSFYSNEITSLISAFSCKEMNIKEGDFIEVFVKANEITLMRISDE